MWGEERAAGQRAAHCGETRMLREQVVIRHLATWRRPLHVAYITPLVPSQAQHSIGIRHVTKTLMIDKAFPITRILKITSHLRTDKVVPSLKRANMRLAWRVGTNWL